MSNAFEKALNEGKLVLRAMWVNPNAKSLPITLQFTARKNRADIPSEFFTNEAAPAQRSTPNVLVAIAGGYNNGFNFTALASWKMEELEKRMNISDDAKATLQKGEQVLFTESANVITADALYGQPVTVHVERTTLQNPFSPTQTPVTNPSNGDVVMYENQSVYQHTWLVLGSEPQFKFEGHGTTNTDFIKAITGVGATSAATTTQGSLVEELVA